MIYIYLYIYIYIPIYIYRYIYTILYNFQWDYSCSYCTRSVTSNDYKFVRKRVQKIYPEKRLKKKIYTSNRLLQRNIFKKLKSTSKKY